MLFAALALVLSSTPADHQAAAKRAVSARPNILLIVTDDQPLNLGFALPESTRWLKSGTRFRETVITTPQCCPSRSTILTGRYAHNHGVEDNTKTSALDHTTTVEYALQQAGYTTAVFGKFLNKWPIETPPPFFDSYAIVESSQAAYKNGTWNVGGSLERISTYGTTFIAAQMRKFLRNQAEAPATEPWFIHLSFPAPHNPFTPEPRTAALRFPRGTETRASSRTTRPWTSVGDPTSPHGSSLRHAISRGGEICVDNRRGRSCLWTNNS